MGQCPRKEKPVEMPTLWKMDASPPACANRVLADLLGIQFDYIDVNFIEMEHKSPEFKKINPLGTVPVLKDEDFILTDSHAINKYLLEKYATAEKKESLYPSDLRTRSIIEQALFFDAAIFLIRLKAVAVPALFEGATAPTERALKDIEDAYQVVECYIGDSGYMAGGRFTLADLTVGVTMAAMQPYLELDSTKFPKASAWLAKLWEIPTFKKYCGPGFEILAQIVKGAWEANKLK